MEWNRRGGRELVHYFIRGFLLYACTCHVLSLLDIRMFTMWLILWPAVFRTVCDSKVLCDDCGQLDEYRNVGSFSKMKQRLLPVNLRRLGLLSCFGFCQLLLLPLPPLPTASITTAVIQ